VPSQEVAQRMERVTRPRCGPRKLYSSPRDVIGILEAVQAGEEYPCAVSLLVVVLVHALPQPLRPSSVVLSPWSESSSSWPCNSPLDTMYTIEGVFLKLS
jgi:hypothetical protein